MPQLLNIISYIMKNKFNKRNSIFVSFKRFSGNSLMLKTIFLLLNIVLFNMNFPGKCGEINCRKEGMKKE